ncbi:calcitonin gene-related peptide 2 [Rattus norvegicus]|nr:calcitonin gene-related peptide 2 [Rattus norvegicus]
MWVLCLASSLQAAPFRSALESSLDLGTLSDQEKHLLLAALIQDYEQKARKLEQEEQETEGSRKGSSSSVISQKRSCKHRHLCDPSAGRLAEQVGRCGEGQLCAHQCGLQSLWPAPQGTFGSEELTLQEEGYIKLNSPRLLIFINNNPMRRPHGRCVCLHPERY